MFISSTDYSCYPTEYAKKQGVWTNESSGGCIWWLRSPGFYDCDAAHVFDNGCVGVFGHSVNLCDSAVRPAVWINLN